MIESRAHAGATFAHGAVFDLDGTLGDTLRDIAAALNHALSRLGRPPAHLDLVRGWVGEGLPTLCRRAMPDGDDEAIAALTRVAAAYYEQHPIEHTVVYPGIRELLDALWTRGVHLGVLSNKPHPLTVRTVEGLRLASFFSAVRGYTTEVHKKPSPTVALEIAKQWNLSPREVIVIGDSRTDIATAKAAGMISVGVSW